MTSTTFLAMVYVVNWITTGFIAGVAFYPLALSLYCFAMFYRADNLNTRAGGVANGARCCRQQLKFASISKMYIIDNKCVY